MHSAFFKDYKTPGIPLDLHKVQLIPTSHGTPHPAVLEEAEVISGEVLPVRSIEDRSPAIRRWTHPWWSALDGRHGPDGDHRNAGG